MIARGNPWIAPERFAVVADLCNQADCASNGGELVFVTHTTAEGMAWNTCSVVRSEFPPEPERTGRCANSPGPDEPLDRSVP